MHAHPHPRPQHKATRRTPWSFSRYESDMTRFNSRFRAHTQNWKWTVFWRKYPTPSRLPAAVSRVRGLPAAEQARYSP
ncbi:hypothetical protein EVAR_44062_1 [Eumeta japonica]|uniref:Uncharacterized protein n=1 Tax=Eumeta variegata TaxID=151549 RepID=A0A4C1X0G0_EUMVA|nr:hypothetical protein EVAR_44062_1 [Eumeta japonica]